MEFWDYYNFKETNNFDPTISIPNEILENVERYKKDVTKYSLIENTNDFDYFDLAHKYFGDKKLWYVIWMFNNGNSLFFNEGKIDTIFERLKFAVEFYSDPSKYILNFIDGEDKVKITYDGQMDLKFLNGDNNINITFTNVKDLNFYQRTNRY